MIRILWVRAGKRSFDVGRAPGHGQRDDELAAESCCSRAGQRRELG